MPLDDATELFYQVDQHDREIGRITRKQAHSNPNIIHRSVAALIINQNDEMLFQKRSLQKDMNPGFWSYGVGGHVNYGQTYQSAIVRELQEELGLIHPQVRFLKKILVPSEKETEMKSVFEVRLKEVPHFVLDSTEVSEVQWVSIDKITHFVNTHPFTDWTIMTLKHTGYLDENFIQKGEI